VGNVTEGGSFSYQAIMSFDINPRWVLKIRPVFGGPLIYSQCVYLSGGKHEHG